MWIGPNLCDSYVFSAIRVFWPQKHRDHKVTDALTCHSDLPDVAIDLSSKRLRTIALLYRHGAVESSENRAFKRYPRIQHCLNFFPLPHGHFALRGTLSAARIVPVAFNDCAVVFGVHEVIGGVLRSKGWADSGTELVKVRGELGSGRCSNVAQ